MASGAQLVGHRVSLDLELALRHAETSARRVGEWLAIGFGNARVVFNKSGDASDVVTRYDVEAEARLREMLGAFDSSIGFYGEERGGDMSQTHWLVDPIDGSALFFRGLPFCTTMIALVVDGNVVLSVIHDFVRSLTYSAIKGGGANCNDTPIHVSNRGLSESYLAVEMNMTKPRNVELYARLRSTATLLSTVSSGWEFAMTASGKLDGRVNVDPWGSVWDYAPGSLLVAEAGGRVANIGSNAYDYKDFNLIAAGETVFRELTEGVGAVFPLLAAR